MAANRRIMKKIVVTRERWNRAHHMDAPVQAAECGDTVWIVADLANGFRVHPGTVLQPNDIPVECCGLTNIVRLNVYMVNKPTHSNFALIQN
jgi:hypothetical protein